MLYVQDADGSVTALLTQLLAHPKYFAPESRPDLSDLRTACDQAASVALPPEDNTEFQLQFLPPRASAVQPGCFCVCAPLCVHLCVCVCACVCVGVRQLTSHVYVQSCNVCWSLQWS